MRAYSLDLRERIAVATKQPGRTIGAVAAQFSVSVSFVAKLLRRQRTSDSVAALPHRSGPAPSLDAATRAELEASLHGVLVTTGRKIAVRLKILLINTF